MLNGAGVLRALRMRTGFSEGEMFRKYLWYLLRERRFDADAVADLLHLRATLSLTDEQVRANLGHVYGLRFLQSSCDSILPSTLKRYRLFQVCTYLFFSSALCVFSFSPPFCSHHTESTVTHAFRDYQELLLSYSTYLAH